MNSKNLICALDFYGLRLVIDMFLLIDGLYDSHWRPLLNW